MRLIDADEVIKFYNEEFPSLDNGVHWSRNDIIMNLHNIPTVKAIPIEWLRNYVSIWISEPYKNFTLNMIKIWEKENETNRR